MPFPGWVDSISDAWKRIKSRAKMDREDWKLVGEALLIGRKANPSNQGFGQWCRENGFGDMDPRDRSDAMWLTENWDVVFGRLEDASLSHPQRIRQAYRETLKSPASTTPAFTQEDAEYVLKINALVERGVEAWFVLERLQDASLSRPLANTPSSS